MLKKENDPLKGCEKRRFRVSPAAFGNVALTAGLLVAMFPDERLFNVREGNPPTFYT